MCSKGVCSQIIIIHIFVQKNVFSHLHKKIIFPIFGNLFKVGSSANNRQLFSFSYKNIIFHLFGKLLKGGLCVNNNSSHFRAKNFFFIFSVIFSKGVYSQIIIVHIFVKNDFSHFRKFVKRGFVRKK